MSSLRSLAAPLSFLSLSSLPFAADAAVMCQRAAAGEGAVNLRVGPSTATAVLGVLTGRYTLEKVGDDASGNGCPGRWLILRWNGRNVRACGTYLRCAATTAATPAPSGAVLCRQNSPGDGFANLRASPSLSATVVGRLTGTTALAKLGEAFGPGCSRAWAKLSLSAGRVAYACLGVLSCGGAPSTPAPSTGGRETVTAARVYLDVPYYYQYDNANRPGGTCNITSLAMALTYRGVRATPDGIFTDSSHVRGATGAVYDGESLARIGRQYGLRNSKAVYGASAETVKSYLRQKIPFILQGYFSNWNFGHILLITGYDATGWYINDPAGLWNGDTGNNPYAGTTSNRAGKGVHYTYDQVSRNSLAGRGQYTGAVIY